MFDTRSEVETWFATHRSNAQKVLSSSRHIKTIHFLNVGDGQTGACVAIAANRHNVCKHDSFGASTPGGSGLHLLRLQLMS